MSPSAAAPVIWPWLDRKRRFSKLKAATFAALFVPPVWLVYQVATGGFGPVPLGGMTYWSGVFATALLLIALAITPATMLLRFGALVIVRRMIGVTALVYTLAHIVIYFALRFWNFAAILREMTTRISLVLATLATLGLLVLGATSFDRAVARMGPRWQQLHDTVYVITALGLVHYLLSPDVYAEQYLLSGIFFWLMGFRLLRRLGRALSLPALAALALAAGVFTMLLEALWLSAYQDYEPVQTLSFNFTLPDGLTPSWKVLILGGVMAALAAVRMPGRQPGSKAPGRQAPQPAGGEDD